MRAFVTGASRGIGQAIAVRLAKDGFDVVVHYHQDADGAEATANRVRDAGRQALVLQADLGDVDAAWACAEAAGDGGLDVFVANAGLYDRRGFEDMTGDAWRRTMAVDLDAPALMSQALLPHLTADARIVFISSVAAARGSTHGAHYSTAKAGLLGLTRSLALELAPRRVNAVLPGYIDTDMIDDTPQRRAERETEVPLGRVGDPQDIAGTVSWLVGPDSAYVTGQAIQVNGGLWF